MRGVRLSNTRCMRCRCSLRRRPSCACRGFSLVWMQAWSGGAQDTGPSNLLYLLERALGVAQHHDAVAGTEMQHVAYNYAARLAEGRAAADALVASSLSNLTGFAEAPFLTCDLANATICPPLEAGTGTVAVLVYNSQAQRQAALPLRVPVGLPPGVGSYSVTAPDGTTPVAAQLLPVSPADEALREGYYNTSSPAPLSWLAWLADVPAAGFSVYFVTPVPSLDASPYTTIARSRVLFQGGEKGEDAELTNGVLTLTIAAATGMLSAYRSAATGVDAPLEQEWCWYNASAGNNAEDSQVRCSLAHA
jgi:lysosomal alpha-mannosidase